MFCSGEAIAIAGSALPTKLLFQSNRAIGNLGAEDQWSLRKPQANQGFVDKLDSTETGLSRKRASHGYRRTELHFEERTRAKMSGMAGTC